MPRSATGLTRAGAVFLVLIALTHTASGARPRLVVEMNDEHWDASDPPFSLLPAGDDRLAFLTRSPTDSTIVLWGSDGTAQGTRPLAELFYGARGWGTLNGLAFYGSGSRAWRTDGTIAGTYPLTGPLPSFGFVSVIARTRVYFIACSSPYESHPLCEVWSTDGTVEGTRQVGTGELADPREMVALGDDAYFLADSAGGRRAELWRASAAEGRVERLKSLAPQSAYETFGLMAAGGRLFFQASQGGRQIWTSDGTAAGTVPITHVSYRSSRATRLLGGYFGRAWFTANDGTNGVELWSSDGTAAGTFRATDFDDSYPFYSFEDGSAESQLAQVGDRLLFTVKRHGRLRLWTTTGNWRTSQPLTGCPGGCPNVLDLPIPTAGGRAAVWTDLPGSGAVEGATELWTTDGTGPGTTRIRRFEYDTVAGITDFSAVGGLFLFSLSESQGSDRFFWSSDGTAEGTVKLARIEWHPFPDEVVPPAAVGGRVFFAASHSLWITSGRGPAAEVFSLSPAGVSSRPQPVAAAADRLLFFTCAGGRCPALWSTDSTDLEPLLEDALDRACGDDQVEWTVPVGQRVLFNFTWDCTFNDGRLLLGTDGTPQGSENIPIPEYWCGQPPVPFQDRAFFTACFRCGTDRCGGLGSSDGTAAGTMPVVTLPAGQAGRLVSDGVTLCFPYSEVAGGTQVWCSDGTAAGTVPFGPRLEALSAVALLDRRVFFLAQESSSTPARLGSLTATGLASVVSLSALGAEEPFGFTAAAGRLWFAARQAGDPARRWWLWSSDGTREGTRRLPAEVRRESLDPYATDEELEELQLTALEAQVYFAGEDDHHGMELWSSDGTVAGTGPVADLAPGLADGAPFSNVVVWNGRLYFAANDMKHGAELWSSDGTAAGTRLEFDLFPGPRWSSPDDLRVAGDRLYFAAQDEKHGRELWVLEGGAP
jgi:large repetitive protein